MFLSSWKRRKASESRTSKKRRAARYHRGPAPLRLSFESLDRRIMLSVTALDSNFGAVETLPYGNSGAITNQATANAEVIQPDGKIIVAGSAGYGGTAYMLARYNTNGTLDTSFGNNGLVTIQPDIQDSFVSVALEANGDIVAGGDQAVLRFSPDGTLLTTQALPFYVSAVAVEPDGSIVAAGFDNSPSSPGDALARLGSNGFLDTSFGTNGIVIHNGGAIVGIVTEADGSIVLGENLDLYGFRIEDYSEDGTLVAANEFNVGGVDSFSKLYSITKQPDGMIVAVGDVTPQDGSQEAYIARVSRFGVLDPTFGVMLTASSSIENAQAVAVQADGQIVIAGTSDAYSGQNTNTIEIQTFNPNGSFAGIATFPAPDQISLTGLALDPDGDVILAATPTSTVGPFYPTAIELVGFSDPPTALGFPDASILAGGPDLDINLASGFSNPTYSPLTYAIVADSNSSLFSSATIDQTTGTLSLSATSFTGQAELTISATNPAGQDVETTLDVTVYNNAPTFTKGADVTVSENSGSQDVASWATNMTAGPGNPKPTFRFSVTGDTDSSLFAAGPAIDGQGNLTFTPAPGASGSATISILMSDGGGTAGGRIDTTPAAQTFTITLTPIVNQPPVFSIGPNETVSDTAGAQVYSNWATGISAGASGEANQILTFDVTTTYGANLFAVQPTILPNGTLRFSPAVGANGTAVVSVVLTDNGGTANGGQDTSVTQSFDITIQDNTNSLSALPALSSLPGAPATLYLNFGGDTVNSWGAESPGVVPAYDQDGDPTTFNDTDLASIKEIWTQVANAYSPFNINVTTVKPASMAHGQTMEVDIGGTGAWDSSQPEGGVAYVGGFTNASLPNLAFVFSGNLGDGDPTDTADAIEHEAGHMLGLEHQSTYSGTTLVDEYNPGTAAAGPIMGVPYGSATARWWDGPSDVSSTTIQDDMAVIADATNGFGYRPDVWNNTMATAATLTNTGGLLTTSGVIEQPTDTDYYALQSPGGVFGDFTISPASFGSTLDFTAELVSSSGQVLSTTQGNLKSVELNAALPKGTDYLVIKGLGDYGDVGQYSISGSISAGPAILGAPNLTVLPGAPPTVINLNTVFSDPIGWTNTPTFTVSTSNPAIFDGTPVIDPQNDTLTMAYVSGVAVGGTSTVTLTTTDDGVSATTSFTVTLQPPVSVSGPVVTINGSSGADSMAIDFTSAAAFSITVDGATSSYSTQNINQIIVLGQGGADTLTVSDTYNTGVGTWNPQFMQWNTAMYQISA
ncbi:MAG TPA: hypothetical protein VHV55_10655, partial [Pirellulales bacterium]|nr:hypothetical protein [Pirellulales bacterium]